MWLFIGGGGLCVKSIVLCVLPWKQGRLLYGRGVYSCRSVESVCVCACMHDVCVHVATIVRLQLMRTDRTKKKRKAVLDDKVAEIKCRGYN